MLVAFISSIIFLPLLVLVIAFMVTEGDLTSIKKKTKKAIKKYPDEIIHIRDLLETIMVDPSDWKRYKENKYSTKWTYKHKPTGIKFESWDYWVDVNFAGKKSILAEKRYQKSGDHKPIYNVCYAFASKLEKHLEIEDYRRDLETMCNTIDKSNVVDFDQKKRYK